MKTFPVTSYWYQPATHLPDNEEDEIIFIHGRMIDHGFFVKTEGECQGGYFITADRFKCYPPYVRAWCYASDLTDYLTQSTCDALFSDPKEYALEYINKSKGPHT